VKSYCERSKVDISFHPIAIIKNHPHVIFDRLPNRLNALQNLIRSIELLGNSVPLA